MNILFLVNTLTKTSIPWRWTIYFNSFSNLNVKIVDLKNIGQLLKNTFSSYRIVHGHHIKIMFIFLIFNFFIQKKSLYTVHGSFLFLSKINKLLLKFIFKYSDKIIFVNKELYDILPIELRYIIKNKYKIILNGVELSYKYKIVDVFKKYNIDTGDIIIFHPARFVEEKNHIKIINALEKVLKENLQIKLVLAGDGKLKNDIIEHIKQLELENSVKLLGLIERDDVYNFLQKCELFIMPSISEGLNIAFLEAISMNCKVIVSNIEQFTYPIISNNIIPSRINVSFVDPLDEKNIETEIQKALVKEKNTHDCFAFSLETMTQMYEKVYKELLE